MKYPMWTQQWPLRKLQSIDRETRKLISENGGRHPLSSTACIAYADLKPDETTLVEYLKTEAKHKFLGVRESVMGDANLTLTHSQ